MSLLRFVVGAARLHSTWASLGLVVGFGLAACAEEPEDCTPGSAGCECYQGQCATGLMCVSNFCVGDFSDTGDGDGDPSGDGDGDPSGNGCDLLIDCVKVAAPTELSSYASQYGPDGECYAIPGLTPEDCWAECAALQEMLADLNLTVSECGPPNCGDGLLDDDEECEPDYGDCLGTCEFIAGEFKHECNPVNQTGCDDDSFCIFESAQSYDYSLHRWFRCFSDASERTVALDGECESAGECQDPSAVCLSWSSRCEVPDSTCCTATCYLGPTNEGYGCPDGYECTPVTENQTGEWPPGSENLGFCF